MRSQFVTKTGVIAATVGSAVGLGNIWRFPYEAGAHGGGAFIFIYIICVLLIGVPVMVAEFAMGRGTHKNSLGAFRMLAPHSPLRIVSFMGIVASLMILSFYSVVAGWIMEYLFDSIRGLIDNSDIQEYVGSFGSFCSGTFRPMLWTLIFLGINFMVLRRGVEKGIEKTSNILMPFLFIILLVLCINSLSLDKAQEGLEFMFKPDFSAIHPSVVIGAMGQAFFSLSLGLTCLMTYASYFSDKTPLVRTATITAVLDLLVAMMAGILIFPATFTYDMEPTAGPTLVFETLPAIFSQMPFGHFWAFAFFLLLFFASLTSTISMSEISISFFIEEWHMTRNKACALNIGIACFFGVFCALSFGLLSDFTIFGKTIFDLFDYVSSNILLPLGGLMICIFVGWVLDKAFLVEQLSNRGTLRSRLVAPLRICVRYIAPIAIVIIFIYGLL